MKQITFIKKCTLIFAAVAAIATMSMGAFADQGLLLYAPFEKATMPTVANGVASPPYNRNAKIVPGKMGNGISVIAGKTILVYDGPGNVYSKAGTASFFWRADADPAGKDITVFDMGPLERTDYNRFMILSYTGGRFSMFFSAGNLGGQTRTSKPISIVAGQWHHLTLCWDQTRGLALYVDGIQSFEFKSRWVYQGGINAVGLGVRAFAGGHPYPAAFSESFDELRIYDRWLDEADRQKLNQGNAPQLQPLDATALLDQRRAMYHWNDAEAAQLPQLKIGNEGGLGLRQVGIDTAKNVKGTDWTLLNGERAGSWPGDGGYSNGGQTMHVFMDGTQRFDVAQIFGSGHYALVDHDDQKKLLDFELKSPISKNGTTPYGGGLAIKAGFPFPIFNTKVLSKPVTAKEIDLQRVPFKDANGKDQRVGGAYALGLFETVPYPATLGASWQAMALRPATDVDQKLDAFLHIRQAFYSTDQQSLMAQDKSSSGDVNFPAMRAVHLVGAAHSASQGLGAIALQLKINKGAPGFLRVQIADPLNPTRFLTAVDVHLIGNSGTMRLLLDHRDMVLPPNVRPVISLTFSNDTTIDLANSTINYQWESVAQALPQHEHDQFARAKDLFQDLSEARSWSSWRTVRGYTALHYILETLRALSPKNETIESYWGWINPSDQKPIVALPPVPKGIPAWAVYLNSSIEELKKIPYWWIDNRRNKYGEYGATDGINDDTDLADDWLAMDFMRGPDPKLRKAYKEIADNGWYITMRQTGLGHYTDYLHTYEDGMNANSMMTLYDYGNPIYIERLMATARHYKYLLGVNAAGHLHFHDDRYGWTARRDSPGKYFPFIKDDGTDNPSNGLALQPAILLGWYNGNQYCIDTASKWTSAMLAHTTTTKDGTLHFGGTSVNWKTDKSAAPTIGTDYGWGFIDVLYASWKLTGDSSYKNALKAAIDDEVARYGYPRSTGMAVDRYIHATGDQTIKDQMIAYAANPVLWKSSLHNDNYYQMDPLYLAWKFTGDIKYIDEATKLTLNDTTWELPMLTSAEQATDRVWSPERVVNRIALGGSAMLRNENYPKMAASWENATGEVAPFVTDYDTSHLTAWVQNMEDHEVTVDMRVWDLAHGQYSIETGVDSNEDGKFDGAPTQSSAELARFSKVKLTIPARSLLLVKINQTKKSDDIRLRADLAITTDDATYDPATQKLNLITHNVGAKESGAYTIRILDGTKVLMEKQMSSLKAPTDLIPKTIDLSLQVNPSAKVQVQLDPADTIPEITKTNNQIDFTPSALLAPGQTPDGELPH